ncbi:MAG TPA: type VI secretion system tube protein Hcp [Verrucomicrobiae bacterium]
MRQISTILFLLLVAASSQASQMYLYLEGIPGEAQAARHAGWIRVNSFSFGLNRSPSNTVSFSPIELSKAVDKSTPLLFQHCASGKHIKSGILDVIRTERTGIRFLQVKLKDVLVSSLQQGVQSLDNDDTGGISAPEPADIVTLSFSSTEWIYTQVGADGRALRNVNAGWNLASNTGTGGTVPEDLDNDGMPDEFERTHGLKVEIADADEDADKDGMTNLEEFRAGTAPNSADAVFKVSGVRTSSGAATLSWNATSGKTYRLMGASSPNQPFEFIRFLTEEEVAGGTVSIPAGAKFQFYVLDVE